MRRPCSSYNMSPLNRGSSHRIPISILLCHTGRPGVIGGAVGVPHRPGLTGVMAAGAGGVIGAVGGVLHRPVDGATTLSAVVLGKDTGPSGSTPTAVVPTQGNRGI